MAAARRKTSADFITPSRNLRYWGNPDTLPVDEAALIYAMPLGAGEHSIVRLVGEGSHTDNDFQFSPVAIPNVAHYTSIRRSLGHTESYVGFEGSYVHSEEPDGRWARCTPGVHWCAADPGEIADLVEYLLTL